MNSYCEEWNYGSNGKSSDTGVWYHLSDECPQAEKKRKTYKINMTGELY